MGFKLNHIDLLFSTISQYINTKKQTFNLENTSTHTHTEPNRDKTHTQRTEFFWALFWVTSARTDRRSNTNCAFRLRRDFATQMDDRDRGSRHILLCYYTIRTYIDICDSHLQNMNRGHHLKDWSRVGNSLPDLY